MSQAQKMTEFLRHSAHTPSSAHIQTVTPTKLADDDVVEIGTLFATLWRGKWTVAFVMLIALTLSVYYAYVVATPLYKSTAVVILETNQENIIDIQSVAGGLTGESSEVNSELEVLRARSLMGKVVDRLDLTQDPEFNGGLRSPSTFDVLKTDLKITLGLMEPRPSNPPPADPDRIRDSVITSLLNKISIRNVPSSLVFQVTAETEFAAKSKKIADTIVELYILNQIEVKFEATEQATKWLAERVSELQIELEAAEAAVASFNASTELVSPEGLQALERQVKDLRDRILADTQNLASLRNRQSSLATAQTPEEQAELTQDPQLRGFLSRLEGNEAIVQAFENRLRTVAQEIENNITRAEIQLNSLRDSEILLDDRISRQSQDLITLQQLTREAEAVRLLYEYFLSRLKETSAQQGIQQADSRILSNAVIPYLPASPNKTLIVAMALALSFMIGVGIVFLREMRNNGYRLPSEVEKHTGVTVLGQIPSLPSSSRKKALSYMLKNPTSQVAEAVRNLRTSLMLSYVDNPPQVIVSTSAIPGEGKTTNSLALAHNIGSMGKKVLLIEGDIRRQTLRKYFKDLPKEGLVSLISGEKSFDEIITRPKTFEADVLGGDRSAISAADLFASDRFKQLLEELRGQYDIIVIDTPPVLVVPDARIISQFADTVLFTIRWDKTTRQQVEESLRLFRDSGQRVGGVILSQIDPRGMRKYGYGDRNGAYARYGSEYYNT